MNTIKHVSLSHDMIYIIYIRNICIYYIPYNLLFVMESLKHMYNKGI
jgi:hypothetical protein